MNNEDAGEKPAGAVPDAEEQSSSAAPIEQTKTDDEISAGDSAENAPETTAAAAERKEEIPAAENDSPDAAAKQKAVTPEAVAQPDAAENAAPETVESSAESTADENTPEASEEDETAGDEKSDEEQAKDEKLVKLESPVFKELAAAKLPELAPENRARLLMQSPTRVFFYWSIKNNPYETLYKALGAQARNYRLVARLVNLRNESEEIFPVEREGSWWFNVEAGAAYRTEVGFYAAHRPFVRLVFSNIIETPRAAPSPNLDASPAFAISASDFAEALDASGYREDAFDIILAGNDAASADEATNAAFAQIAGNVFDPAKFAAAELRSVLYALASGAALEDLRQGTTPLLFDYLVNILEEQPDALDAENVLPVWESNFGTEHTGGMRMQRLSATVFGASSINFPRLSERRKPKLAPVSSFKVSR